MTCFRPRYVVNPRFRGGKSRASYWINRTFHARDFEVNYYLPIPCGRCFLCRKKRANSWRIRLVEECKSVPTFTHAGVTKYRVIFVCFTFSDDCLPADESRSNIASFVRRWRDLWRKKFGRSPRYFAVTDKGSQFGRLHLHFLIFNPFDYKKQRALSISYLSSFNFLWKYGFAREPSWLEGMQGISYVSGYMTSANLEKDAIKHGKSICKEALEYFPLVFVSNGLGSAFKGSKNVVYDSLNDCYLYEFNGYYYGLPTYYRNAIVDDETRWHQNLLYKYLQDDYMWSTLDLRYFFRGKYFSPSSISSLYLSDMQKFDTEFNKYENICQKTTLRSLLDSTNRISLALGGKSI